MSSPQPKFDALTAQKILAQRAAIVFADYIAGATPGSATAAVLIDPATDRIGILNAVVARMRRDRRGSPATSAAMPRPGSRRYDVPVANSIGEGGRRPSRQDLRDPPHGYRLDARRDRNSATERGVR
jgi:hypothetical protein